MLISARVEAAKLAILAKHFESLGTRVRSKSQLVNLVVDALLAKLTAEGAMLDTNMSPGDAVEVFVRLGFEPPHLNKAEQDEEEARSDVRAVSDMVSEAVARVTGSKGDII